MPPVREQGSRGSVRWRAWRRRGLVFLVLSSAVVAAGVRLRPVRSAPPPAEAVLEAVLDQVVVASVEPLLEVPDASEPAEPFRAPRPLAAPSPERLEAYAAPRAKTVLDLQLYRETYQAPIEDGAGVSGIATLVDLNPLINRWFLLILTFDHGRAVDTYHLENTDPEGTELLLDPAHPTSLVLRSQEGVAPCALWSRDADPSLAAARARQRAYVRLCGGRLLLRSRTEGRKTRLESATDFLRDRIRGGEALTVFVRKNLYRDSHLAAGDPLAGTDLPRVPRSVGAPPAPRLDPRYEGSLLMPEGLALELEPEFEPRVSGELVAGRWYPVRELPGAFVAAVQPQLVNREVIAAQLGRVLPLDDVESRALVYLVAFDVDHFEVAIALGTDHPRVTWSERTLPEVRNESLPGPDGIGTTEPLARTGQVDPISAPRLGAAFAAGFKRSHGAFKRTGLATHNFGSHYGFVEQGTVLSKLQPGLATVVVWYDGRVELRTWREEDNERLGQVRHARQNGVPLIEPDSVTGEPGPGELVPRWMEGNWSGSQDQRLRTLRAGLCQLSEPEGDYLVYGYFSSATPSGMARVFQASGCRYALLLDMNALEHTYLATYRSEGEKLVTSHLMEEMKVLDETGDGRWLPRFLAFPDNRDFFYLLRREPTQPGADDESLKEAS
ncbi:MAG: hypothetical protein K8J08_15725 [Thermoanaerobaculia bacterium]|nr:hypothetical protein [Thermoanaerobaculia bacterium]